MRHINIAEVSKMIREKTRELRILVKEIEDKLDQEFGTLIVRFEKRSPRYYERIKGKHNKEVYLRKNSERIKDLENQNYYRKLLQAAKAEIEALNKTNEVMESIPDTDRVFFDIAEKKRHLIAPFTDEIEDIFIAKWESKQFRTSKRPNNQTFMTQRGEKVRSKSELIIADRLYNAGVPYYYEYPTTIDAREVWFPDFFILNKRTGCEYYWEHFGMMDNSDYCSKSLEKIEIYERNNIIIGKNLIITMESREHQIGTDYIERIIKDYLL